MPKTIMNCHDWWDQVQSITKTKRKDNDVTDHTGAVYTENDIELSWPIGSGADAYENKIGQLCD